MNKDNFHFVIRDITHHQLVQLIENYEFYLKTMDETVTLESYYNKFVKYEDGQINFTEPNQ